MDTMMNYTTNIMNHAKTDKKPKKKTLKQIFVMKGK